MSKKSDKLIKWKTKDDERRFFERKQRQQTRLSPREEKRMKIEMFFDLGKEFRDTLKNNSIEHNGVNITCIERDDLHDYLGGRSKSIAAIESKARRVLAKGGFLSKNAIKYDKDSDAICFFIDRIEDAPGNTRADKVLFATASVMGIQRTASLFDTYEDVGLKVTTNEREVVAWLEKEGIQKPKYRPRRV